MSLVVRGLSGMSNKMRPPPLTYKVIAECGTTKARVGCLTLRHGDVDTPVFMPVGTQVSVTTCIEYFFQNNNKSNISLYIHELGNIKRTAARPTVQFELSNYSGEHLSFGNASG